MEAEGKECEIGMKGYVVDSKEIVRMLRLRA
jgi:hypothetical protein